MGMYMLLVTLSLPAMASGQFIGGGGGVALPGSAVTPPPPVTFNVAAATAPAASGVSGNNDIANNNQYFNNGFFHSNNFNTGYGFNTNTHVSTDNCPNQTDFSADLLLSSDPTGYPIDAINLELVNRPDLLNCLAREVVLPTAPKVPADPVLTVVKQTCPSANPMLWSFFRYNARCWLIQNVQEMVNFTVCGSVRCQNCDHFFSSSGSQSRCIRQFQYFSVWAFCEGLPALTQISRERIILPYACNCQKIRCYANDYFWRKRK
ncbi:uncharacterized protein LOC124112926 [Haliotis rufescens]|uniref:uncharacterized protein LOC124112926 n=1 Tax=Haliotis rufescens TaxID=6454 RepID=UPI001EB05A1F|nr:uncharacterized protein LOC124112926 [Haliotis rufescens]